MPLRGAFQRRPHSLDLLSGFLAGYWSEYTMVRRELYHWGTLYSTTAVPTMEDSHNRECECECECDDLRERQSDLFPVVTRRIEYSSTAYSITSPSHSSALRPSPSVPLDPNFQYQKGTETVWLGPGLLTTHFLKWRR